MASAASRWSLASTSRLVSTRCMGSRALHSSSNRRVVSPFHMPAMSPTMTEGGISAWKKKEGQSFAAGDVLLEIETDKATIDVEAPDDGVLGKVIAPDGTKNIPVGKLIALLAEEGDDLSNIEIPAETTSAASLASQSEPAQPPSPSPSAPKGPTEHDGPMFPSVLRLLHELHVSDFKTIKGTGVRGMLTKGDVLAFFGKASTPTGTFKHVSTKVTDLAGPAALAAPKKEVKPLDGLALRQLIASGLNEITAKKIAVPKEPAPTFDSVLADYLPNPTPKTISNVPPATPSPPIKPNYFDGLF